jgi:branched-subunit amino acid transport protein
VEKSCEFSSTGTFDAEMFLILAGMALATYLSRFTIITGLGHSSPRPVLRRWLQHVPAAVLAALIVPATPAPQGHVEVGLPAWSVLFGAIVAWRTRSVLWTIVSGMVTFWLLRALGL